MQTGLSFSDHEAALTTGFVWQSSFPSAWVIPCYVILCVSLMLTKFQTHFEICCFHSTTSFPLPSWNVHRSHSPYARVCHHHPSRAPIWAKQWWHPHRFHIRHVTATLCCHCHITAQVRHHPSWPPHHPNDKAPKPVTPSVPLPSLRDVGIPIPPKRPRHDNNNNAATLSIMPTPCHRPPSSVEHHVSEYEGMRRRKWGDTRQRDPHRCPRYAHTLL